MCRACGAAPPSRIGHQSVPARPRSGPGTDFGRWCACTVPIYARTVSTAERTGRRLTPGQTTWLSSVFAVVIGGLIWLSVAEDRWQSARTLFWGDLALGVASLAAMQCRRRWPIAVTVLTLAATAVSGSAIGPWIVLPGVAVRAPAMARDLAHGRAVRPGRAGLHRRRAEPDHVVVREPALLRPGDRRRRSHRPVPRRAP